ncbi:MAG TPA: UbiA family prenyltransferase [Burkholderiales bacterium]|nr:UbiA family prenyltransferase [Burkholderiales bacterium]
MSLAPALSVALRLGRISNLPTVWTNTLVGVALAGGSALDARVPVLLVAASLFYVGGMFLNDAFDREFDARSRPDRPIPAGQVTPGTVFGAGFAMLAAGVLLLVVAGYAFADGTQWRAPVCGLLLAGAIVLYDAHHKDNPLSPVLMGVCRVLVYFSAALAISAVLQPALLLAAVVLLCYLIGLTYTAKREHLNELGSVWPLAALAVPLIYGVVMALRSPPAWPFLLLLGGWVLYALWLLRRRGPGDVPRAVVSLIAGISLVDAVILCGAGAVELSIVAVAAFLLTMASQRVVSGT